MDQDLLKRLVESGAYTFKTTEQGAATSVLAVASPLFDGVTGTYLEDCNEARRATKAPEGTGGVAPTPSTQPMQPGSGTSPLS
jgi:hypothetical protein